MKPAVMDNIERTGDLGGVQHNMTFDENSIAHIMSLLTDLYSDPLLAVIREYSTNAYDAHIEAGTNKPIEITLPTGLSPQFVVKDYGIGMSADDIRDIYSKYGKSTKRDTNDQVGMLGLGCKSALTYTAQFMLTGVKDGIKTYVSISRNNDGTGVMEVISSKPTNEPNGVTIAIPIQARHFVDVEEKSRQFFRFWQPNTVLVNGKDPSDFGEMKVGDYCYLVGGLKCDYVVMGNVSYPLKSMVYAHGYSRQFGVVAFVEIGDVHFTPSREDLHYTAKTNETIFRIGQHFRQNLEKAVEDDIANCDTHAEAIKKFVSWTQLLPGNRNMTLKYMGQEIPSFFRKEGMQYYSDGRRDAVREFQGVRYDQAIRNCVIVTGFDAEKVTPSVRTKMRMWAEQNVKTNRYLNQFILVDAAFGMPWLSDVATVTFDEIKALKIPRNPNPTKKKEPEYDVMNSHGVFSLVPQSKIDTTKPIYYTSNADRPVRWGTLTGTLKGATLVKLNKNRWEKFQRDFPSAKHIHDYIDENMQKAKRALSTKDKYGMGISWYSANLLKTLDENRVDDPTIVDAIKAVKGKDAASDELKNYSLWMKICQEFNRHYDNISVDNPLNPYPLLLGNNSVNREHAYVYINAIYKMSI